MCWCASFSVLVLISASTNLLYAFFYDPGKIEKKFSSWGIYQPAKEFARMGLGTKTTEWRLSHINKDYLVVRLNDKD